MIVVRRTILALRLMSLTILLFASGGCVLQWHQSRPAVKGRVSDVQTNEPIPTVTVKVLKAHRNDERAVLTVDEKGRFRRGAGSHPYFTFGYPNWGRPARYIVTIDAPGYLPKTREFDWWVLQRGWSVEGDVVMERENQ